MADRESDTVVDITYAVRTYSFESVLPTRCSRRVVSAVLTENDDRRTYPA